MPHQCVKCGHIYENASTELLKGCSHCTGKFFFFIKENAMKEAQKLTSNLTSKEKEQMEKDVLDIIGVKEDDDNPVILDFESIRVLKPGKYDLDLVQLFKKQPLVYKTDDGKYIIDIASSFQMSKKEEED